MRRSITFLQPWRPPQTLTEDISLIRRVYGSRAQTLINALLAFDAYFAWLYPLLDMPKTTPYACSVNLRESCALDNCRRAIHMHEMLERVSASHHKSFLPHAAIFKVRCRDILNEGNTWALSLSPLELQNADTKRVAHDMGSRRLTLASTCSGTYLVRTDPDNPRIVPTKGLYSSTMAISTYTKLVAIQHLRRGDGIKALRDSRRNARAFGENGAGRLTAPSAGKMAIMRTGGGCYNPRGGGVRGCNNHVVTWL